MQTNRRRLTDIDLNRSSMNVGIKELNDYYEQIHI